MVSIATGVPMSEYFKHNYQLIKDKTGLNGCDTLVRNSIHMTITETIQAIQKY